MNFTFLTRQQVLRLHELALEHHGGQDGTRDEALLEAAIAMPEATFGGELLHPDVPSIAAAYAFHLCQNHPFIDGNKRVALACALFFARYHGFTLGFSQAQLEKIMLDIASGVLPKAALTELIRESTASRS